MRSTVWSNAEFWRRLAFTVGALVVWRAARFIPLPSLDLAAYAERFRSQGGTTADLFSGGAIRPLSIGVIGVYPYLTASFAILIVTSFSARLRAFMRGRRQHIFTRWLALIMIAGQAYLLALGLERVGGTWGLLVHQPGDVFRLSTVLTLTATSFALIWLAEQITLRGIGNGFAVMLFVGLVGQTPRELAWLFELGRRGIVSASMVEMFFIGALVVIAFVVVVESAQYRIPVNFAAQQLGIGGGRSELRFKFHNAGIIPPIFAAQLMLLPGTVANELPQDSVLRDISLWLAPGSPAHMIGYVLIIIVLCFLYTALLLSPRQLSRSLEQRGGVFPNIAGGSATADYLDGALTRITLMGAIYLAAVCVLPEISISQFRLPVYFGGSTLLVIACVAMDALAQVRALRSLSPPPT